MSLASPRVSRLFSEARYALEIQCRTRTATINTIAHVLSRLVPLGLSPDPAVKTGAGRDAFQIELLWNLRPERMPDRGQVLVRASPGTIYWRWYLRREDGTCPQGDLTETWHPEGLPSIPEALRTFLAEHASSFEGIS